MGEENKKVEILTKAGPIVVRENRLGKFKAQGATMLDGSEIETPQERLSKAVAKKAKKKKAKG